MVNGARYKRKRWIVVNLNLHWAFGAAVVIAVALAIKLLV